MSRAHRCDICAKYYNPYEQKVDKVNGLVNGIAIIHKGFDDYIARKLLDTCPECLDSIIKLMNELTEKEK